MRTSYLPSTDDALGQWTTAFATNVATLLASIGITSAQSTALNTANTTWVNALAAAKAEATRSKPTITAKNTAKANVLAIVRQLVGIIQTYPGTTNEMRSQLGITVPKNRTPAGAPGTPSGFKAVLAPTGQLTLTWKNRNATGCVYMVYRRLGTTGEFVNVIGTGYKKFVDTTIPTGTSVVQYQVQAVRSTGASGFGQYSIQFGTGSNIVTASESAPVKLAA